MSLDKLILKIQEEFGESSFPIFIQKGNEIPYAFILKDNHVYLIEIFISKTGYAYKILREYNFSLENDKKEFEKDLKEIFCKI